MKQEGCNELVTVPVGLEGGCGTGGSDGPKGWSPVIAPEVTNARPRKADACILPTTSSIDRITASASFPRRTARSIAPDHSATDDRKISIMPSAHRSPRSPPAVGAAG